MTSTRLQWPLLVGFVVVALASGVGLYVLGGGSVPGVHEYRVQAVVPTAVAVVPGAEVRKAGVTVGEVEAVAVRGGNSVLMLALNDEEGPVFRDATVAVRLKSVVGENYVELDPGHASAGAVGDGGVLPIQNAAPAVQLDEILSAFPRRVRRRIQTLLDGLGGGLAGHGDDLNRLLDSLSGLVDASRPTMAVLGRQHEQVGEVVQHLGEVMRAVGDRGRAIEVLARQGKAAATAVAVRDRKLAQTLRRLPSALRQVASTTEHLGRFSTRARPVLADLRGAAGGLAPAVSDLRRGARRARSTIAALGRFSRHGRPLLDRLRAFSPHSTRAMPALDATLRQITPLLEYLSPYAADIAAFFSNTRSATGYYDATGNLARVLGVFAPNSLPVFTPEQARAFDSLVAAGALQPIVRHGVNAYPAPGAIGEPKRFTGRYPRLEALPPANSSSP